MSVLVNGWIHGKFVSDHIKHFRIGHFISNPVAFDDLNQAIKITKFKLCFDAMVLRPTLLSPGELRHYFLKKISADIGASLLFHETSKSYCKQISIWSWHPTCLHLLVKIILDYKPQTSTSCSLKKFLDLSKKLILKFEFLKNLDTFVCITQP